MTSNRMKLYFWPPIILQFFTWFVTTITFFLFWSLEVRGAKEAEKLPRGVIFASNHSGEFDPILIRAALPFFSHHSPMFYTSRERDFYEIEEFGWRHYVYGGIFFNAFGAYPVYVGLKNYKKSLKNHIEILEDKGSLCIFPEGHATKTGPLLPGKGGVAYLAYKTNAPIVPIGISGLRRMTPKDFFFDRRKVVINYGKPLYAKDLFPDPEKVMVEGGDKDDYKIAAKVVMSKIQELLDENQK